MVNRRFTKFGILSLLLATFTGCASRPVPGIAYPPPLARSPPLLASPQLGGNEGLQRAPNLKPSPSLPAAQEGRPPLVAPAPSVLRAPAEAGPRAARLSELLRPGPSSRSRLGGVGALGVPPALLIPRGTAPPRLAGAPLFPKYPHVEDVVCSVVFEKGSFEVPDTLPSECMRTCPKDRADPNVGQVTRILDVVEFAWSDPLQFKRETCKTVCEKNAGKDCEGLCSSRASRWEHKAQLDEWLARLRLDALRAKLRQVGAEPRVSHASAPVLLRSLPVASGGVSRTAGISYRLFCTPPK